MGKATYTEPVGAHPLGGAPDHSRAKCPNGCGEYLVFSTDAIGRVRARCPKCDGVAPTRRPRPGEVRRSQVLYPTRVEALIAPDSVRLLPPVAPGQLRCQRCAEGVEGRRRVCARCERQNMVEGNAARRRSRAKTGTHGARVYRPRPCDRCGREYIPTGPKAKFCHQEGCR